MDARVAYSGTIDGRFERVVHHLVTRTEFVPAGLGADVIVGHFEGSDRRIVILRHGPEGADTRRWAEGTAPVEIVVVGGEPPAPEAGPSKERVILWHVAEDGTVRSVGDDAQFGEVRPHLDDADHPPDWLQFWAAIDARVAAGKEAEGFREGIRDRRPRATQVLVAVIVGVYVLGMGWGAPDYLPALTRLGSLDHERVADGEVWRLLSSTFLHGSVIHLAMNMWVLWSLGSLERVIGTWRFLALYASAGIVGSVASIVFSTGYAVGASGALWGLMVAQMVLGWRGKGILPTALLAAIRDGSLRNLAINVGVSFLPGVGWAAHAGGGVAGAVLALAGVVTVGLPRWAELAPGAPPPPDRVPIWLRMWGQASGVALALSLGAALWFGRAWEAAAPPVLARAALGATGWTAEVPAGLRVTVDDIAVHVGHQRSDPGTLELILAPLSTPPTPEERDASYAEYAASFAEDMGAGLRATGKPERIEVEGASVLEQRFVGSNIVLVRAVVVGDHGVVFTNVVYWKDAEGDWGGVARRAAASAAPG